jgi:hypothetical protein
MCGLGCHKRGFGYLNATSTTSYREITVGRILGEQEHCRTAQTRAGPYGEVLAYFATNQSSRVWGR